MAADKEGKVQAGIIAWLEKNGFWTVKTIVCNKTGIMDIIACAPTGRFIGIEVKYGNGKPSEMQKYHIEEVKRRNGIAFVAWDLQTVISYVQSEIQDVKQKAKSTAKPLL